MRNTTQATPWLSGADEHIDLRKASPRHALADLLVRRSEWLPPAEQELILAMFRDGRSAKCIAHMLRQDPRHVRRRLKHLVARLRDPRLAYVVANQQHWGRTRRRIARLLFIEGKSMREATRALGVSMHCVRTNRDAIEAMCQAPQANPPAKTDRSWREQNKAG